MTDEIAARTLRNNAMTGNTFAKQIIILPCIAYMFWINGDLNLDPSVHLQINLFCRFLGSIFQDLENYTGNSCLGCTKLKIESLLYGFEYKLLEKRVKGLLKEDLEDMNLESDVPQISIDNPNFSFDYSELHSLPDNLRTLLIHNSHRIKPEILSLALARFRVLRVLQLSNSNLNHLPDSIGDMIHLRFLNLSFNWNLETLPDSICNLCRLQTLNLKECVSLKELPLNFTLLHLKHLFLENCISLSYVPLKSDNSDSLTSLLTLDRLIVNRHHGGLQYLKYLNCLRGVLTIELPLEGWPNCKGDAKELNMSEKHQLRGMNICWIKSEAETTEVINKDDAQEVLSALVPHTSLAYLSIDGHIGDALSGWDVWVEKVKKLILINCSFEHLDYRVRTCYTSLETLKLNSLTMLKGWRDIDSHTDRTSRPPPLPNVSEVVIQNCPQLKENVPLLLGAKILHLLAVNVKLVESLLTANGSCSASSSTSTSDCQYNTKLIELRLHRVESLSRLPRDWIQHLTALKRLSISGCRELNWVSSHGLGCLISLETLSIFDCGAVKIEDSGDSGMPWERLQRLRDLTVPWQRSLQEGLQYLTALERLEIHCCGSQIADQDTEVLGEGLKNLWKFKLNFGGAKNCCPPWIKNLCFLKEVEFCNCKELSLSWSTLINMKTLLKLDFIKVNKVNDVSILNDEAAGVEQNQCSSLEEIYIFDSGEVVWINKTPWELFSSLKILSLSNIPNLTSLPNGINLKSLVRLVIGDCSKRLKDRCTPMGADWPLICKIKELDIR